MSLLRRRQRSNLPTTPVVYPNGTYIRTEKGAFFIVSPGKRYRFTSDRVLESWAPHRIVETTEAAVSKYRVTAKLRFRNGSLIHNIADGKIYLIEDGKKRHITNPEVFERIGAKREDTVSVSLDEIKLHEEGVPLS